MHFIHNAITHNAHVRTFFYAKRLIFLQDKSMHRNKWYFDYNYIYHLNFFIGSQFYFELKCYIRRFARTMFIDKLKDP